MHGITHVSGRAILELTGSNVAGKSAEPVLLEMFRNGDLRGETNLSWVFPSPASGQNWRQLRTRPGGHSALHQHYPVVTLGGKPGPCPFCQTPG